MRQLPIFCIALLCISIASCALDDQILAKKFSTKGPHVIPGSWIIQFEPGAPSDAITGTLQVSQKRDATVSMWDKDDEIGHVMVLENISEQEIDDILSKYHEHIEFVQPDSFVHAASQQDEVQNLEYHKATTSDEEYFKNVQRDVTSWGLDRIDQVNNVLDESFYYNETGKGVNVYLFDSGMTRIESEFGNRIYDHYTVIAGESYDDLSGHGTTTSGNIASVTYGVAKAATLHNVKVLNSQSSGKVSGIIDAIRYVRKNHQRPAVAHMGIVFYAEEPAVERAISDLRSKKILTVIAGNSLSIDACNYSPVRKREALAVGVSNKLDDVVENSNYGKCIDIYSPGDRVNVLDRNGQVPLSKSGSSISSSFVAGLAAVYLEREPKLSPSKLKDRIVDAALTVKGTYRGEIKLLYTNASESILKLSTILMMLLMALFIA